MKFRKKPVEIEARHWDGTTAVANRLLAWIEQAGTEANLLRSIDDGSTKINIQTLEGVMSASPGDYIIRGVQGEFYPCKPDIFDATYEAVE